MGFLILTSRPPGAAESVTLAPAAPTLPGVPVTHAGWKNASSYEQLRRLSGQGTLGSPVLAAPCQATPSALCSRQVGMEGGDQGEWCRQTLNRGEEQPVEGEGGEGEHGEPRSQKCPENG